MQAWETGAKVTAHACAGVGGGSGGGEVSAGAWASLQSGLHPCCGFVVLLADAGECCQVNWPVYSCVFIIPIVPVPMAFVLLK